MKKEKVQENVQEDVQKVETNEVTKEIVTEAKPVQEIQSTQETVTVVKNELILTEEEERKVAIEKYLVNVGVSIKRTIGLRNYSSVQVGISLNADVERKEWTTQVDMMYKAASKKLDALQKHELKKVGDDD